jgi:predicted phage replisome organizer
MNNIKWIKITTDIFDDEKILLIENMPEHDSIIVIWFKLLALAGKSNNNGVFMLSEKIPYTDEMLASVFRRPLATVRLALNVFEKFGMIVTLQNVITIPNWEKHQNIDGLDKVRQQTRERVARCRAKQKNLVEMAYIEDKSEKKEDVTLRAVTSNDTVTQSNALEKNRKEKNRKESIEATSDEVPPAPKKQKHIYGEYKKVKLTDDELEKLKTDYGEQRTLQAIQYLDEYKAMKGKKYDSDYLAMRKWVFKALDEKQPFMKNDVYTGNGDW